MCAAALEAGKHVICDKPMALNGQEAEQMLEAARQHPHQVHHHLLTPPHTPLTPLLTPLLTLIPHSLAHILSLLSRHVMQCMLQHRPGMLM